MNNKNEVMVREYLGSNIEFKKIDGIIYANATSMASAFENGSQKLKDWKRSKKTKELIDELNEISDVENLHNALIISDKGGIDGGGGTWIEENLLLDFAQYLNVKFRVWCNKQISTLMREGSVSIQQPKFNLPTNYVEALEQLLERAKENEQLKLENTHKTNLIDNMTSEYDGTYIRTVCHDYVNKISHETGKHQSELYSNIYTLLGRTLKKDIDYAHKQFVESERNMAVENRKYNYENNLKGEDRRLPYKVKETKANISKIEYVCDILGEGAKLLEIMAKVFEVGIDDIIKKYQIHVESNLLIG